MKIKKLLLILSTLGLVSSLFSQSGNKSYKLTDDVGDSITAIEDPRALGSPIGDSPLGEIRNYSESELDTLTKFNGTAAGRSGLFAISGGNWTWNETTYTEEYTASSAKLEPVEDLGDFVGAPLVANVSAEQVAGTKNVSIGFWLQFDEQKSSNVYIEVWFRESSNEVQWERCMEIGEGILTAQTYFNPDTGSSEPQAHTKSGSSEWVQFEWEAGTEKPNFKGEDCQIRVMAIYPKQYEGGGGELPVDQQGSGWDGYEVEQGNKFVRTSDPQVDVKNPDFPNDAWEANLYFLAHIEQNNISRNGTAVIDGKNFPVYGLSADDLQAVTGIAGTAGNYAFSGYNEFLDNGTISHECIIGRVIPQ